MKLLQHCLSESFFNLSPTLLKGQESLISCGSSCKRVRSKLLLSSYLVKGVKDHLLALTIPVKGVASQRAQYHLTFLSATL